MTLRENFDAIMNYKQTGKMPVWFFGSWPETKKRWLDEGLKPETTMFLNGGSGGPQLDFMDTDWETSPGWNGNIWNNQGILSPQPISGKLDEVLEETDDHRIVRTALGGVRQDSKGGESISHFREYDLKPTREDWERFKQFLNPDDPARWSEDWESRAEQLNHREHVTCCLGGSLFGWLRNWMGVEALSYLPYDEPELYAEMIDFMTDYFIRLNTKLLDKVQFDFAYIFEDCCFSNGPLISPDLYREFYHENYVRLIAALREKGVKWILLDSDGYIEDLLPLWLESGFDIIFPIEVGTWKADPVALRKQYGKRLRMMGGINKHVIRQGEAAIREELEALRPLVAEGGYIPLPDHRIPPDVSLAQMKEYVRLFGDVFSLESVTPVTP